MVIHRPGASSGRDHGPSFLLQIGLILSHKMNLTIPQQSTPQSGFQVITICMTVTSVFASFVDILFSITTAKEQPQVYSRMLHC